MSRVPNTYLMNDNYSQVRRMVSRDGWMYVAGYFTTFGGVSGLSGICRYSLATGDVDPTWKPAGSGFATGGSSGDKVHNFSFNADGSKIFCYAAGGTTGLYVIMVATAAVARVATVNLGQAPIFYGDDNHVYLASFNVNFTVTPTGGSATTRVRVAQFSLVDNSLTSFNPNINDRVNCIVSDADHVYLGGHFTTLAGVTVGRFIKLNKSDGSLAGDWAAGSGAGGVVAGTLIGGDNNIYLRTTSSTWNGISIPSKDRMLIRISKQGVWDAAWVSSSSDSAYWAIDDVTDAYPTRMIEVDGNLYLTGKGDMKFQGVSSAGVLKVSMSTRNQDQTFNAAIKISPLSQYRVNDIVAIDNNICHIGVAGTYNGYAGGNLLVYPISNTTAELLSQPATNHRFPKVFPQPPGSSYSQLSYPMPAGQWIYLAINYAGSVNGISGFKYLCRYATDTYELDTSYKPQNITSAPNAENASHVLHDGKIYFAHGSSGQVPFILDAATGAFNTNILTYSASKTSAIKAFSVDGDTLWISGEIKYLKNADGTFFDATVSGSPSIPLAKFDMPTQRFDIEYATNLYNNGAVYMGGNYNSLAVDSSGVYVGMTGTVKYNNVSQTQRLFKFKKTIAASESPFVSTWAGGNDVNGGTINSVLVGSNGSVYIGGYWSSYNGVNISLTQGQKILKLDSNGVRDTAWTQNNNTSTPRTLMEMDGAIYVGYTGSTTTIVKSTNLNSFTVDPNFVNPTGFVGDSGNAIGRLSMLDDNIFVQYTASGAGIHSSLNGQRNQIFLNKTTGALTAPRYMDLVQPSVVLACGSVANGGTTALMSLPFTATFSESVTGMAAGDVTVTGGSVSNFSGSGTTYSFDVIPSGDGVVSVSIGSGVCADAFDNTNAASAAYSFTVSTQPESNALMSPTSPSVARKQRLTMTLDKVELDNLTEVSQGIWKRVLVVYQSAIGKVVVFYKPSQSNPTGKFFAKINQAAEYQLTKIFIVENDGEFTSIPRASIPSAAQYDVSVT